MIAGDVAIEQMEIGLLSVTVSGLDLTVPLNSITIAIDELHIGFSLSALLRKKWEPQELIDRITVMNPHITVITGGTPPTDALSPAIEEMIPFRMATVKNCIVSIEHPLRGEIITISGLDGDIVRQGSIVDLTLNGAVGSLIDNVSLHATVSNDFNEQHLSVRLKGVEFQDIIPRNSGVDITGTLNGSIETQFREGHFPHNMLPDGWLTLSDFSLRDSANQFFDDGIVELLFENGIAHSNSLDIAIPGGTLGGHLNFDFSDTLSGSLSLNAQFDGSSSIDLPIDIGGVVDASVTIPNVYEGNFPIDLTANLLYDGEKYHFQASGVTTDGGVQFDTLVTQTPFGSVQSQLTYENSTVVINGDARVNAALTPSIRLSGAVPFSLYYNLNTPSPDIKINSRNLSLHSPSSILRLPPLSIQTIRESIIVQGRNEDLSVVAHIAEIFKPLKQYHADVAISESGVEKLSSFMEQSELLTSGELSVIVDGIEGVSTIHTTLNAKGSFGAVSISGKGVWGDGDKRFNLTTGNYLWSGIEFPFTANIVEDPNGDWQVSLSGDDVHLETVAHFSNDFSVLESSTTELSYFPFPWVNQLIPSDDTIIEDGFLSGSFQLHGSLDSLSGSGELEIESVQVGSLDSMHTFVDLEWDGSRGRILPFRLNRDQHTMIQSDTILFGDTTALDIRLNRFDLGKALTFLGGDTISGAVSGYLTQHNSSLYIFGNIPSFKRGEIELDSIRLQAEIKDNIAYIDSLTFVHHDVRCLTSITYPLSEGRDDTLQFEFLAEGDLLASAEQIPGSAIGGTGEGSAVFRGSVSSGEWDFTTARLIIPQGKMSVVPYVHDSIENLYADFRLHRMDSVSLTVRGNIDGKQAVVKNEYDFSPDFEPMTIGGLNLGVIHLFTEEGGVPLYIPGFIENRPGNVGYIEVAGKDSVPAFTLSGTPPDGFMITGTILLRKADITFPLLNDYDWGEDPFDPFPMIGFDLDVRAADRSVTYFYRMGMGNEDRRRSISLIECTFDPSRTIGVRGRDQDDDFRVTGSLRFYKGFLFYGKMFDQNFEMGLDFSSGVVEGEKHDNLPIIWGSAETYTDSSRTEQSEVIIMTRDEEGNLVRRGRLTELVIQPATGEFTEDQRDEQGAEFYTSTGEDIIGLEGAGTTLTGIGDRYVNSFVFNYWGRQAARYIGLDMIRLETSVMSNTFNYLYQYQLDSTMNQNIGQLALANTGITLGKYVANDQLLLKMRTQFSTLDTLLIPEYKFGVEYQPLRYLWMDFNYGIKQDYTTGLIRTNPEVRLQLRMPFSQIRNAIEKK